VAREYDIAQTKYDVARAAMKRRRLDRTKGSIQGGRCEPIGGRKREIKPVERR